MRSKLRQRFTQRFHFVREGVHVAVLCRMEPVHLRRMLRFRQHIQHRQHRRLPHAAGEQRDRRFWHHVEEEIPRWCRQIKHIAFLRRIMQPVRHLPAVFALNRNAIAFAVGFAGQGVLANFLMRKTFRLQPDRQILAWMIFRYRAAVDRLKFKAGNQRAARRFFDDAERAGAFPAAGFAGAFAVDLRLTVNKDVGQYAVSLAPGIQHFLAGAEHFVKSGQQVGTDNVVLLGLDLEAGMLLGDFFHRRQQGRQVLKIAGIGGNSVEQRLALVAVALIAHIEDFFEFRIMSKHPVVKMGGQFRTGFNQQGDGGFHRSDGLRVEHSSFLCRLS